MQLTKIVSILKSRVQYYTVNCDSVSYSIISIFSIYADVRYVVQNVQKFEKYLLERALSRTQFKVFNTRRPRAPLLCLHICLFVCPSVCLSVYLSVCHTCGQRGPRSGRATKNSVRSHVLRTSSRKNLFFCELRSRCE